LNIFCAFNPFIITTAQLGDFLLENGGRPRYRWEDNIRMDLRAIEWEDVYWLQLAQDRDK
jgi:hypothetical protein